MDTSRGSFNAFNFNKKNKFDNLTSITPYILYRNKNPFAIGPSMHIIQHYRKCLNFGGADYLDFNINNFLSSYNQQSPSMQLLQARTIFYLGFISEAEIKFNELSINSNLRISTWANIYILFCKRAKNPVFLPNQKLLNELKNRAFKTKDIILKFYSLQSILIFNVRNNFSKNIIPTLEELLKFIQIEIKNKKLSLIFELRIARYIFLHLYKDNSKINLNEYENSLINLVLKEVKKKDTSIFFNLMLKESFRRYLDGRAVEFYQEKKYNQAIRYTLESIKIDQYCPRINLIHGEILYLLGNKNESIKFFKNARLFGIWERPFATKRLNELKAFIVNIGYENNITSSFPEDIIKIKKIPIYTSDNIILQKTNDQNILIWKIIKKSKTYKQFRGFFDLGKPTTSAPDISLAPNFSYQSYVNSTDFRFNSIALQRMAMPYFRSALFGAALKNNYLLKFSQKYIEDIYQLKNISPKIDFLLNDLANFDNLKTNKQNLLIRAIGNLGFTKHAELLSNKVKCKKDKNSYLYVLNTNLFYRLINGDTNILKFKKNLYEYLNLAPDSVENFRAKFSLYAIGMVYFGQNNNHIEVNHCRKKGVNILKKILNCDDFSDFDKNLIASRFYRAASYYPFLVNNNDLLNEDIILCEYYARNAKSKNSTQNLLFKDNLYSTLDTLARIQIKLKNYDKALMHFQEINNIIDKFDTKILISEGDLEEKLGHKDKAFKLFLKAAHIESPQGKIAWYRAGILLETSNQLEEAKECYLNSLKIDPTGISPTEGLMRISKTLKDKYLENWSKSNLTKFKKIYDN